MEEPSTWSAKESVTFVASRARRERLAVERLDLLASLSDGVARLVTGERWARYLEFQSRFHRYSAHNTMLLLLQNPYATRVAGYRAWQALDRQVRAGETALRILAPVRYRRDDTVDGEYASEVRGFRLVSVFDVRQTEGPALPDVVSRLEGLAPAGVFDALVGVAHGLGFRVERPATLESGANGDTSHAEGRIRVVASHAEAQQVKTLAHEIAHALLHESFDSRALAELEAES
ncbi:MAG: ArdC-like ssDNA-binding domain-containing protein, partial [Acidimicrobiales bacterium]